MKRFLTIAVSLFLLFSALISFTDPVSFRSYEIIKLPGPDESVQNIKGRELQIKDNFFNAVAVKRDKEIIYISNEKNRLGCAIAILFRE